ncbi:MAG: methyltransferase domain-containing protein [Chloroflexi bacterium]|nr:methyltransferase domain-containing protein [Chloroflexota bacterium]
MKSNNTLAIIKPQRERSIINRHPWVYSGAIHDIKGDPTGGETIDLVNQSGEFLARGAYSPHSKIKIRIWSWNGEQIIDDQFIYRTLEDAISRRNTLLSLKNTNAYRLVYAESDRFPGLIVDLYDNILVMQCLSFGAEFWRETIADSLTKLMKVACIYERSDAEIRQLEGLSLRNEVIRGILPENDITIIENGLKYLVDVKKGQKTGFFLDQRQNRLAVRQLAQDKNVLDCFCYTGGFSISALAGEAKSIISIDTSDEAINIAKRNVQINYLDQNRINWIRGDVFTELRKLRDYDRKFDMIILDPPKFAFSMSQVEKAARGYKDINLLAMKLLNPGGLLVTFSCSGSVNADLFQKIVAGAALDAGVGAQIINQLHQAEDHPILLSFPEGQYLKGLIIQVNK